MYWKKQKKKKKILLASLPHDLGPTTPSKRVNE